MPKFRIFIISLLSSCFVSINWASESQRPQAMIRSGIFFSSTPYISQPDLKVAMQFWASQLGQQVSFSSHTTIYTNINKMRDDFDKGIINFIVAKPLSIIQGFDLTKLTAGYKAKWSGITADNLLVISHKKANINNFSSVKNKHLSLILNDPISEIFVNTLALEAFDLPAKQVFKKIEFIPKSNQLILNLFFQKTDVILIYKSFYELASELNPQIKNNTQIIASLPNLPRSLGFFHPSVEATLREQVLTEIENLKSIPQGQQLLELFRADSLVRSDTNDLDSIKALLKRYQQLSNNKEYLH